MSKESYTIEVDHEKKIISMKFFGNPSEEEVTAFHHEYLATISPIQASEYLLLLDSLAMGIPESERLHQMQVSFALYRKSGFKEICFILKDDELRRQVRKLIVFSGMMNDSSVTFITPEEVNERLEQHVDSLTH